MRPNAICIIGMGYVGLTLATVLAERGFMVYGVEANKDVIAQLRKGKSHVREREIEDLLRRNNDTRLIFSDEIPKTPIDVFVMAVGTPVDPTTKKPGLASVENATREIAHALGDGQLVILRSTVPIGTTRTVVLPILQKTGKQFFLAFCPERTAEGRALEELQHLPQIIGGLNDESVDRAMDFFRRVTHTTIEVESLEAAEMVKLIDNSYRDVMFSYANEIALIAEKFGLNAHSLIEAANLGYPRNHIARPGYVGGACLEKDPYILHHCAAAVGYTTQVIMNGRKLNEFLPVHVIDRVTAFLKKSSATHSPKIFISGFAFKGSPETNDLRGSPTLVALEALKKAGYKKLFGHDFAVTSQQIEQCGVTPCTIEEGFRDADIVLLMNNHLTYRIMPAAALVSSMKRSGLLFDSWQMLSPETIKALDHVVYESIGYC